MTPTAKDPPDLLASLPDAAVDPAALKSLRAEVRDLAGQVAELLEAARAERPEPVTREMLEAWGEALVERLAERVRAAAPAVDPIATEELRTGVHDLRQAQARLEKAVGRPVTPEALEAWGEALVNRVLEAARAADARSASTESQRRMEAAAARIEKALERTEDRLRELKETTEEGRQAASGSADGVARIEADLGALRKEAGGSMTAIEGAVERLGSAFQTHREAAGFFFGNARNVLPEIVFALEKLESRRRWLLALVFIVVFVLGMTVEGRIHLLYRWLWAG